MEEFKEAIKSSKSVTEAAEACDRIHRKAMKETLRYVIGHFQAPYGKNKKDFDKFMEDFQIMIDRGTETLDKINNV